MRFPVNKLISFIVLLIKTNTMITRNKTIIRIFLVLALILGSCKNENKLKEADKNSVESTALVDNQLSEKKIENEYGGGEQELDQDKNYFKVHGTDEDGNQVSGSVNIEGKVGIGIIHGVEANAIEIVAEHIGHDLLIATDVKGYEYKLKVDHN